MSLPVGSIDDSSPPALSTQSTRLVALRNGCKWQMKAFSPVLRLNHWDTGDLCRGSNGISPKVDLAHSSQAWESTIPWAPFFSHGVGKPEKNNEKLLSLAVRILPWLRDIGSFSSFTVNLKENRLGHLVFAATSVPHLRASRSWNWCKMTSFSTQPSPN